MLRSFTAIVLLVTMMTALATQAAMLGFCLDRSEFFFGEHEPEEHSCGHESEHNDDCDEPQEPCDDEHVEIQIDLEDFSYSGKSMQLDHLPNAFLPTLAGQLPQILRPIARLTPVRLSHPPPDLPVYLRFGVLRL